MPSPCPRPELSTGECSEQLPGLEGALREDERRSASPCLAHLVSPCSYPGQWLWVVPSYSSSPNAWSNSIGRWQEVDLSLASELANFWVWLLGGSFLKGTAILVGLKSQSWGTAVSSLLSRTRWWTDAAGGTIWAGGLPTFTRFMCHISFLLEGGACG